MNDSLWPTGERRGVSPTSSHGSTSGLRLDAHKTARPAERVVVMYRLTGDSGPEPLGEILARLITARGWGRRQARLHLERAWAVAVGLENEAHTRVLGLRRDVLEVE